MGRKRCRHSGVSLANTELTDAVRSAPESEVLRVPGNESTQPYQLQPCHCPVLLCVFFRSLFTVLFYTLLEYPSLMNIPYFPALNRLLPCSTRSLSALYTNCLPFSPWFMLRMLLPVSACFLLSQVLLDSDISQYQMDFKALSWLNFLLKGIIKLRSEPVDSLLDPVPWHSVPLRQIVLLAQHFFRNSDCQGKQKCFPAIFILLMKFK